MKRIIKELGVAVLLAAAGIALAADPASSECWNSAVCAAFDDSCERAAAPLPAGLALPESQRHSLRDYKAKWREVCASNSRIDLPALHAAAQDIAAIRAPVMSEGLRQALPAIERDSENGAVALAPFYFRRERGTALDRRFLEAMKSINASAPVQHDWPFTVCEPTCAQYGLFARGQAFLLLDRLFAIEALPASYRRHLDSLEQQLLPEFSAPKITLAFSDPAAPLPVSPIRARRLVEKDAGEVRALFAQLPRYRAHQAAVEDFQRRLARDAIDILID